MKRIIFRSLAAIPLLTLAFAPGCKNETVESRADRDKAITFNSVIGKQTLSRAAETTLQTLKEGDGFDVFAFTSSSASTTPWRTFTLTHSSGGWVSDPVENQPGFALSYYAYYPETTVTGFSGSGTGGASFSYTVPVPQEDLVAAYTPNTTENSILLGFDHILSQVNFAIQGMEDKKITVSNISVNTVANSSTYNFATGWGARSGNAVYAYMPTTATTTGEDNEILYLGNGGGDFSHDNALMLMPQTFAANTGGNFTFSYSIRDMGNTVLKSGSATVYFGDFATNVWAQGKRYVYLLDFTNLFEGGPITFRVVVNPWEDAGYLEEAQPLLVPEVTRTAIQNAISQHNALKGTYTFLTRFPISLPVAPTVQIDLTVFDDVNFGQGDKIMINCVTSAGAELMTVGLAKPGWSISTSMSNPVIRILTKQQQ